MTTLEVGKKLVELCNQGKNMEAMETLYAQDICSVEAGGPPGVAQKAPLRVKTAGTVLTRMLRSRKTDQRSR